MNERNCVVNFKLFYFNNDEKLEIFHIKNNKFQGILPTNMLEFLQIHNSSVSDVYMDYISNMIYQFHHFTFGERIYSTTT